MRGTIAALLGAATTVAVTWWIVLSAPPTTRGYDVSVVLDDVLPSWNCTIWNHGTAISVNYRPLYSENAWPDLNLRAGRDDYIREAERMRQVMKRSFWTFSRPPSGPRPDSEELHYGNWYNETAIGWPMWAMKSGARFDGRRRTPQRGFLQERYWALEVNWRGGTRALPLQPIWRGFLVNSFLAMLVWLALMWLTFDGVRTARQSIRRRRNRCIACNYDRGGLPAGRPCPECGTLCESHEE